MTIWSPYQEKIFNFVKDKDAGNGIVSNEDRGSNNIKLRGNVVYCDDEGVIRDYMDNTVFQLTSEHYLSNQWKRHYDT